MSNVFDQFDPAPAQESHAANVFDQFDEPVRRVPLSEMPMAPRDEGGWRGTPEPSSQSLIAAGKGDEPQAAPMPAAPTGAVARVAEAAEKGFGPEPVGLEGVLSPKAMDWLKQHDVVSDKGILPGDVMLRLPAALANAALRGGNAAFRAGQQAVVEIGKATGQERLFNDLAAIPEAFPLEIPGVADYAATAGAFRNVARQAAQLDRPPIITATPDRGDTPPPPAGLPGPTPEPPPVASAAPAAPAAPAAHPVEPTAPPPAPAAPVSPAMPEKAARAALEQMGGLPVEQPPAAPVPPPNAPAPVPHPVPQQPPQQPQATPGKPAPFVMVDPDQLSLEPKEFQYKTADEKGVTGALEGVKEWNPDLADPVTVLERPDGRLSVVNGHQRTNLAQQAKAAGQPDIQVPVRIWREADGYTPEYMRALGAYQNIAQGSGSPLDAARVLRGTGSLPPTMRLPDLPPKSALVRDAAGLAQLSPEAFGAVENGVVAPEHAAKVGELIADPTEQMAAIDMLARARPGNANQARLMVQDIRNSGFLRGAQTTLFGDEEFTRSLVPERAVALDNAMRMLRRTGTVFRAAVEGEDTLAGAGNALNREGNVAARTSNAQLLDALQRDATTRGPISDALTAAASDLATGKPAGAVTSRFLAAVRQIDRGGEGSRVPDGDLSGGTGHAPEAGTGDANQPDLIPPAASMRHGQVPGNSVIGVQREVAPVPVKRGAQAMINRLRMQANLDAARNRTNPDRQVASITHEEAREVEDFIDFIGHHMFDDVGMRFLSKGPDDTNGRYSQSSRIVAIFRNAVETGRFTHTAVHELWHTLERTLPDADATAINREFLRVRDRFLAQNEWARPFAGRVGLRPELVGDAAKRWIVRYGATPAAQHVSIQEPPNGKRDIVTGQARIPVVRMLWTDQTYRFHNASEYWAETMTDRSYADRDIQNARARSLLSHIRDIFRRMIEGLKRLWGDGATARIFEGFRNGEYAPTTERGMNLHERNIDDLINEGDESAARRTPKPPQTGAPLFGEAPPPAPQPRAPEPTIKNDARQVDMFGTRDAAVQTQAARDQAGRGALLPKTDQKPADEGLFTPKEPQQDALFSRRDEPRLPNIPDPAQGGRPTPQIPTMPPDSLWGGKPPERPPPKPPEVEAARIMAHQTKNPNAVERLVTFPRTMASLDDMSAHFWNTWQERERQVVTNADQLRGVVPTFKALSDESRARVVGALEIGRIQGEPMIDAAGNVTAHNISIPHARWSKEGDALQLSPEESRAYHEAVELGRAQWEMLMRGTAKRYGWDGELNPALIRVVAGGKDGAASKSLMRLADLLSAMKLNQQSIYVPFQRFGNHYIAVRPNKGDAVTAPAIGDKTPLAWFETVEKPALQDVLGTTHGRNSVERVATDRIAELQKQFPPDQFSIEHGDFSRKPSLLRKLDIPAIEKLMMLMENTVQNRVRGQVQSEEGGPTTKAGIRAEAQRRYEALHADTIEAFENELYEELKAGYRRKARVTPGYSDDFDRAIGTHMYQIARNSADMVHRDAIESAYTQIQDYHPHENMGKYWRGWRDYQERPDGLMTRAVNSVAQVGLAYVMGMSPSSTIIMASHTPLAAAPVLSVGIGPKIAGAALLRGLGPAYRALAFGKDGASIDMDRAMAGMPAEKQAFLRTMATEGRLAGLGAQDLGHLSAREAGLWGSHADTVRHALELATSNVSAVDQANRFAVASAAWDIASKPERLNAAATPLMQHSALFRNMVERDGLSPATFGRFMLSEAAFEWGKQARAPIMRGPLGTLAFTLHGFQTRFLSTSFNLLKNRGPAGRMAGLFMMGALALGAGIFGLPFVQDADNAVDYLGRKLAGHAPDIKGKLQDLMGDSTMGRIGAHIALNGPLSTLTGVDVGSRIGFGDVLTRSLTGSEVLGSLPSIVYNAATGAYQRGHSGQDAAAVAAEAAPMALRGPLRALAASGQGVMSRSGGTQYVAPQDVSKGDLARMALGFTPLSVNDARGERERFYEARQELPAIRDQIRAGDTAAAVQRLRQLGMTPNQVKMTVREVMRGRSDRWFQRFEQQRQSVGP